MSNSINKKTSFGFQDTSFKAAGKEEGLRKLSLDFYFFMDSIPQASSIRSMHEEELSVMTDKLTLFLSMWLGGHKKYLTKYGTSNMQQVHKHLVINQQESDAWLLCMDMAIEKQAYSIEFKSYLKKQFRFPANMIQKSSKNL